MSSKPIEDLKKIAHESKKSPLILEAALYIENIENSEINKKIISFGDFIEKRKENPDSKRVDIIQKKKKRAITL